MVENFFYSIEFRDLNFEYDRYYLSLEEDPKDFLYIDNNSLEIKDESIKLPKDAISNITPYTIVPKFSIDKKSTPVLFHLINIDYNILIKSQKKEKEKQIEKEKIKIEENKQNEDEEIFNINEIKIVKEENNIIEKEDENNININNEIEKPNNENLTEKQLYLKSINMRELTLHVKSFTNNKIVFTFQLRYPLFSDFYTYLGERPDNFKILQYPCILLQYESASHPITKIQKSKKAKFKEENFFEEDDIYTLKSGYYALKKIIIAKKDDEYYDEEIEFAISSKNYEQNQNNKNKNKNKYLEHLFINRQKPIKQKIKNYINFQNVLEVKGIYDSTLSTLKEKKEELIKKKKEFTELLEKRKIFMNKRKEMPLYEKQIQLNKNSWKRFVTMKELLNKINTYTTEVILLKEKKISKIKNDIDKYKKIVSEKKTKKIPNLQKINKGLQISNYFLIKYYISEICQLFFNKSINRYNAFPTFYKLKKNELIQNKSSMKQFFISNKREISSMFGNIVNLMIYISKKFDIIFPYALYYNGSKSIAFISMGINNSGIDLYIKDNESEDDIFLKMDIISKMIYDVILFFYSKGICSTQFKIDDINGRRRNKDNNMYLLLIKLNQMFKDILGKSIN